MNVHLMRIKASIEAGFIRLFNDSAFNRVPRDDRAKEVQRYMTTQIDRWMEECYRRPRTVSDILDNRHHKLARRKTI